MHRLTIAHVLPSFGVGGQERVALDLAGRQLALGHGVTAFSLAPPPDGPLAADFHAAGVATETVSKGPRLDPTLVVRLAARLRRRGADVVHTHNPLALIYGAPAAALAGAAIVHTKHGENLDTGRQVLLRRAAATLVDAFVAVSETTAESARATRDVAPHKLSVVANGVDLARFGPDGAARAEVRRELGLAGDAWVVGTVGRLVDLKNQALLIRALAPTNQHLVLVGDGPERTALERLVAELGAAARVHFAGRRADVPRWLRAFDVFALPSRSEGLPLVVPEAMATALPVVATRVGGVPQVVDDGSTGFLVASEDEVALRDRLVELARDRERARAFGARARALALERYSLDRMSEAYLALYRGALAERRRGVRELWRTKARGVPRVEKGAARAAPTGLERRADGLATSASPSTGRR
jgi:glycosyltransferase involved in cell wall biosynthesis